MTTHRLMVAIVAPLIVLSCRGVAAGTDIEVVQKEEAEYKTLIALAAKWKDAVVNKSMRVLIDYALPEDRPKVTSDLSDPKSNVYTALFVGDSSVLGFFSRAKDLGVVLLRHNKLRELGRGTDICYYNKDRNIPQWPTTMEALQQLEAEQLAFCVFVVYDENRWCLSYSFAEPDDGL